MLFCLLFSSVSLLATSAAAEETTASTQDYSVQNVRFDSSPGHVTVSYDLIGPVNATYDVRLILKRSDDKSFEYIPKKISGDVGTGKFAGKHDRIYWNMDSELPGEMQGDNYYFVVDASRIPPKSSISVWFSAAVIAAAAAIVYLVRP